MHFTTASLLLLVGGSYALNIDFNNTDSISKGAKTIIQNIISLYNGTGSTGIPGLFPQPYYWWESGLAWDSLINYWSLTGDSSNNHLITQALLWQVGSNDDFMPTNQTASEGNDDQAFWGLACMTAAEKGFPAPPASSGIKSWLELAENVFNTQAARWDNSTCDGGLRWQIFSFNQGYNYKNAGSNGDFMQLAARLAHYTGNQTYVNWANRTAVWSWDSGLVNNKTGVVYDGFDASKGCKQPNKDIWTLNYGTYLSAYSYLANVSSSQWLNYADVQALSINDTFAWQPKAPKDGVITEVACQPHNNCNADEIAFRTILVRSMANFLALTKDKGNDLPLSNYTLHESVAALLRTSAEGAAAQCSGGKSGNVCGSAWYQSKWDGTQGLGQDLSALEVILANMPSGRVDTTKQTGPVTPSTSGSSKGGSDSNKNGAANLSGTSALLFAVFGIIVAFLI